MRARRSWIVTIAAILALTIAGGPVPAQPAKTLVVGLVAEPVNLDPAQVTDVNSSRVGRRIVETLVTFPEESTQLLPGLAESWTISRDALQYTFKLRPGITFHDGTPLNAQAVKFSIMWVPESGSGMQAPVAMATVMQSNLKAVGVNVTLETMEWGTYLAKLRSKEQELFALSWMAGTEDPDMVMYPLLHSSQWTPNGPNRALYKNPKYDALLEQARHTTDQTQRATLYREAQRILVDDAPWVFVDHEIQIAALSKRVQGFKLHPSFDLRVETISLK